MATPRSTEKLLADPRPEDVPEGATLRADGLWCWARLSLETPPLYRYLLGRRWAPGPRVLWVMLNPSTADATTDDPTVRKCLGFTRRFGAGSLEVVNLWAYRAASPKNLANAGYPVGSLTDTMIVAAARRADRVVCGWGANVHAPRDSVRPGVIGTLLRAADCRDVRCLGLTQEGAPRHPLMLSYRAELVDYNPL